MSKNNDKSLMNEKQAALEYPYSVHWFRRARWAGMGPKFIKMGAKVLYRIEDLEEYFNKFSARQSTKEYQKRSNRDE